MTPAQLELTEKQKAIIANLISRNDEEVVSLIQNFREDSEPFIILPLVEMLFSNRSQKLKDSINEFIIDIKNQAVVQIITQSIRNHINSPGISGLVSVCWQSRLDFSEELPLFVQILCNGDYLTSFEASTVIENSLGNINKEQRDSYITQIKKELKHTTKEKQLLLSEMIEIIEKFEPEL